MYPDKKTTDLHAEGPQFSLGKNTALTVENWGSNMNSTIWNLWDIVQSTVYPASSSLIYKM